MLTAEAQQTAERIVHLSDKLAAVLHLNAGQDPIRIINTGVAIARSRLGLSLAEERARWPNIRRLVDAPEGARTHPRPDIELEQAALGIAAAENVDYGDAMLLALERDPELADLYSRWTPGPDGTYTLVERIQP